MLLKKKQSPSCMNSHQGKNIFIKQSKQPYMELETKLNCRIYKLIKFLTFLSEKYRVFHF